MKYFITFLSGAFCMMMLAATYEADLACHFIQQERPVVVQETPNTDGLTKRVTYEIYIDRIASVVVSNDVIRMTNEMDSGNAKFKTVPVDPRLNSNP